MRMRKVLGVFLALVLMMSAGAVFGGGAGEKAQANKTWRIAFIPQLIGIPYFTAMENGGNDAAKAFGVTYMNVGSPTASAAEQVRLMENLIQQKVDAISISVLDSASLNPVMERAEKGRHQGLYLGQRQPDERSASLCCAVHGQGSGLYAH